jgi:N-ethylmaleimide reductase
VDTKSLFTPLQLGALELPHRIVMAPMTRMRAGVGNVATSLNAEYYAQRASAALIISEGTAVSAQAQGYPSAPGIYTQAQIEGWRMVAEQVHARGGRIIMQIAHNGRNSHSSLVPDGKVPVAPSAVPPNIPAFTIAFQPVEPEMPRALELPEITQIVKDFGQAAANALEAGFDGVELQAANSHLIEQFLEDGTNRRTDEYGGPIPNRARFLLEVVEEVSRVVGKDRLGVRLSPFGRYGGISDSDPMALFHYVIKELNGRIGYLHLIEALGSEIGLSDQLNVGVRNNADLFRTVFSGPLITAAAYTPESALLAVEQGRADAVAFGRLFLANPDLVERIRDRHPLNAYNRATFYGGGAQGYTDYPRFSAVPQ